MRGLQELESRLRRLEDRHALQELIHAYCVAIDARDMSALADMLSEDASFEHSDGIARGRDDVLAYYRRRLAAYGTTYHYPHSQSISFDGFDAARATGVVNAHAELSIDNHAIWIALRYEDEYARHGTRWTFRSRRQRFVYVLPLDELPTSIGDSLRRRWPGQAPAPADLPDGVETYKQFVNEQA